MTWPRLCLHVNGSNTSGCAVDSIDVSSRFFGKVKTFSTLCQDAGAADTPAGPSACRPSVTRWCFHSWLDLIVGPHKWIFFFLVFFLLLEMFLLSVNVSRYSCWLAAHTQDVLLPPHVISRLSPPVGWCVAFSSRQLCLDFWSLCADRDIFVVHRQRENLFLTEDENLSFEKYPHMCSPGFSPSIAKLFSLPVPNAS